MPAVREAFGEDEATVLEAAGCRLVLGDGYLAGITEDVIFRTPGLHPFTPELAAAYDALDARLHPDGVRNQAEERVAARVASRELSALDRRWELSPESKLGSFNLRAYKPVYLFPVFWTSKRNDFPASLNPQNNGV